MMRRVAVVVVTLLGGFICMGCTNGVDLSRLDPSERAVVLLIRQEKEDLESARFARNHGILRNPMPWGLVWRPDDQQFGAGHYVREMLYEGLPRWLPRERVEVLLTPEEAVRYFELLFDRDELIRLSAFVDFGPFEKDPGDLLAAAWLQLDDFVEWPLHRYQIGRELIDFSVRLAERMGKGPEGDEEGFHHFMLRHVGGVLLKEFEELPLEEWPRWYETHRDELAWHGTEHRHFLHRRPQSAAEEGEP